MSSDPNRRNQYFVPGEGIAREVITADICKYLDNDAMVRPGDYQGRVGYFIYAYRNLTTEQLADLQADSARWEREKQERARQRHPRGSSSASDAYVDSRTHYNRQQVGPTPPDSGSSGQGYGTSGTGYGQSGTGYGSSGQGYRPTGGRGGGGAPISAPVGPTNMPVYSDGRPPLSTYNEDAYIPSNAAYPRGGPSAGPSGYDSQYVPASQRGEAPRNPGANYEPNWDRGQSSGQYNMEQDSGLYGDSQRYQSQGNPQYPANPRVTQPVPNQPLNSPSDSQQYPDYRSSNPGRDPSSRTTGHPGPSSKRDERDGRRGPRR